MKYSMITSTYIQNKSSYTLSRKKKTGLGNLNHETWATTIAWQKYVYWSKYNIWKIDTNHDRKGGSNIEYSWSLYSIYIYSPST